MDWLDFGGNGMYSLIAYRAEYWAEYEDSPFRLSTCRTVVESQKPCIIR